MNKARIVYLYNVKNTFINIDENLLEKRYQIETHFIKSRHPRYLLPLWQSIKKADVVVAWFASWHSLPAFLMARMTGKPCVLITGGYDVANVPEINYGLRRGGLPYLVSEMVFRLSHIALPFSETAYHETLLNTPLTSSRTRALLLGVVDKPAFKNPEIKQDIAITIGNIDHTSVRRKGIRLFVEAAAFLPKIKFIVVGKHKDASIDELLAIATDNVEFTGFVSDETLDKLLIKSKVYVQASRHEGFGLSVAESMLARCIPVVSKQGSLPEVVGDAGLYLNDLKPKTIANTISEAMESMYSGESARQRILDNFSIEQRAEGLYNAIDALLS